MVDALLRYYSVNVTDKFANRVEVNLRVLLVCKSWHLQPYDVLAESFVVTVDRNQ